MAATATAAVAAASAAMLRSGGAVLLLPSATFARVSRMPWTSLSLHRLYRTTTTHQTKSPFRHTIAAPFCTSVDSAAETSVEAEAPPPADPVREAAGLLEMRVGRVVKAWRHPEAESLYVEEVDVGEEEPRTICSGLVNYIPLDDLQDQRVVVLANLKPRNMRGIKSNGMLMAASDASHENVELLLPPEGSVPGERIWFGSEEERENQTEAATPNQVQKKKIWESVQPHLKTTDTCVATLGIHRMRTSAGVVVCKSLKNANIS